MERTLILLNGKKYERAVGVLGMTSFKMAAILVAILGFTQITVTRRWHLELIKNDSRKLKKRLIYYFSLEFNNLSFDLSFR